MKHTWIELDLGALRDNIARLRAALRPDTEIIFVVKSDAYGHGMLPIAECAVSCGIRWLAVSHMDEARLLRQRLPEPSILVLGVIWPEDVSEALDLNIIPLVVSDKHGQALGREAAARGQRLPCHAKIDTGMGRIGLDWASAADAIQRLSQHPGLNIAGACTHFAFTNGSGKVFTDTQAERFTVVTEACQQRGVPLPFCHMSHSGLLPRAQWHLDAVRTGIVLFGYGAKDMRPVLHWKTRVIQVKPVLAGFNVSYAGGYTTATATHIATLDVGYADGYPRLLSNKGHVLIRGQRHPVAGRVTMNMIMVDLGPETAVTEGDVATLIGTDGEAAVWADEIAKLCRTIPYEILTSIRTDEKRVRKSEPPNPA
ncbi:MAG: alanine racemase [Verrucomicrobia bacterium]|nr:alanine racemase [Verrucomicrobiota bacterium]